MFVFISSCFGYGIACLSLLFPFVQQKATPQIQSP